MTNKPKAYIHIDLETTSLRAYTGQFYSIGCTVVDHLHKKLPHTTGLTSNYFATEIVPPDAWDNDVWAWAKKTYGSDFVENCVDAHATFVNWRATQAILCMNWAQWIRRIENAGYELFIICNHADFDATMLRAAFDNCNQQFPIHYRNVLDLPSIIMGHTGKVPYPLMKGIVPASQITHDALSDSMHQATILASLVPQLPE